MNSPRFPPVGIMPRAEPWESPQTLPNRSSSGQTREERARRQGREPGTEIFDPHHYGRFNGSLQLPVGTAQSSLMLAEPPGLRNMLILRNNSATANIYVEFGNAATTATPLRLTPNTMVLFDVVVPQDDVFAIADAASAFLSLSFSNIA